MLALAFAMAGCSVTNVPKLAVAPEGGAVFEPGDFILVEKSARTLTLVRDGRPTHRYRIALGRDPVGPKWQEGDGRTPEGLYHVAGRNPNSRYHLALRISYPNLQDLVAASARGAPPGGDIMIHGLPNGITPEAAAAHPTLDWTDGCIALTNREIEELWMLVDDGMPVVIGP